MAGLRLIGDIGGLAAHLALARDGTLLPESRETLHCDDYPSLFSAIHQYLKRRARGLTINESVLALAGPVRNGEVVMTNQSWSVAEHQFDSLLGIRHARLLNNFEAIALSLPRLEVEDYLTIGPTAVDTSRPLAVMGPGRGMGVALCIPHGGSYLCQATEGGHAGLAPGNEEELAMFHLLLTEHHAISRELLLSGPGLQRIYRALAGVRRESADARDAREVFAQANRGVRLARAATDTFCALLGSACGDQALASGSVGGIFLAGSFTSQWTDYLAASQFRKRFEQKPPMNDYLQQIGTAVITCDHPGLVGCANATLG